MKKVSLYLMMLGLFFVGIFGFNNTLFSATTSGLGTGEIIYSCDQSYSPVCGVKKCPTCAPGQNCIMSACLESYKTFSNECVLSQNKEGYTYFSKGECGVAKSITLSAPASVEKGKTFTLSRKSTGYDYCMPTGEIELNQQNTSSWLKAGKLPISGSIVLSAPSVGSTINSGILGVQCYYSSSDSSSSKSDTRTQTIKFTAPVVQCAQLGEAAFIEAEPSKYKKCCSGLTEVYPPSCQYVDLNTGLIVYKDGCGSICVNRGDGICDSRYENSVNSEDCVVQRNISLSSPANVVKGTTFSYSWKASGYEYCIPTGGSLRMDSMGKDLSTQKLLINGSVTLTAPAATSTLTGITVGVQCYYKSIDSSYKSDLRTGGVMLFNPGYCGDKIVQSPNSNGMFEQCDDGNKIDTDYCANTCKKQSVNRTYCGDGIVQIPNSSGVYEECDDGNTNDTDMCSNTCKNPRICTTQYAPVCGVRVNEMCPDCMCAEGYKCDCGPCIKTYDYKTFSNKCVLGQNTEGYSFYKEGECKTEVKRNITLTAPSKVTNKSTFKLEWNAQGYDSCTPRGSGIKTTDGRNWIDMLSIPVKGSFTLDAGTIYGYLSPNTIQLGVACKYYGDNDSVLTDYKNVTVQVEQLTVTSCIPHDVPVCGVKQDIRVCPACHPQNGAEYCPPCPQSSPIYKTFSNKCELDKNIEGYEYYKDGTCEVSRNIVFNAPDSVNMGNNFSVSWKATNYEYCETVISYPEISTTNNTSAESVSKKSISGELKLKAPNYDNESSMKVGVRCYYYDKASNERKNHFNSKKIKLVKKTEICSDIYAPVCGVKQGISSTCDTECMCAEGVEDCICPTCPQSYPIYKTYSNKCLLEKNTEGYEYYNYGKCKEDCISNGEPVCGVKYLQSCNNGGTCRNIPVYKTFLDSCDLDNNTAKYVFYKEGYCDEVIDDTIKLTNSIKLKLDKSINKLIDSVEKNYTNKTDKINYINKIIDKLVVVQGEKPKYKNITAYIIDKLNSEITRIISEDEIDIDEIIDIFN